MSNRSNTLLKSDGSRNWVTPEELENLTKRFSSGPLRFLYGDEAKRQYADLRSADDRDKRQVALVTEQDGKKRFNTLLKSDGTRNWVTPEEMRKLSERSSAWETAQGALEAKVSDLSEKLECLQALYENLTGKGNQFRSS